MKYLGTNYGDFDKYSDLDQKDIRSFRVSAVIMF